MKTLLLSIFSFLILIVQAQTLDSITPDNNNPLPGATASPTIIPIQIYGSNTYFNSSPISFNFLQGSFSMPLLNTSVSDDYSATGIIDLQQGSGYTPSGFYDLRHTFVQGTAVEIFLNNAFCNYSLNGTFTILEM